MVGIEARGVDAAIAHAHAESPATYRRHAVRLRCRTRVVGSARAQPRVHSDCGEATRSQMLQTPDKHAAESLCHALLISFMRQLTLQRRERVRAAPGHGHRKEKVPRE